MSKPEQGDLERLFDLSVDMLFVSAADTKIVAVNPSVLSTLGYTEEELIGRPFLFMIHPDDLEKTIAEVAAGARGQTTLLFECRCLTSTGGIRWFQVCARTDTTSGRIYASVRDVTHQHSDHERMQRYADLLERTQAELKGALDELTRVANTDQLTGLMNRRSFDTKAKEELDRAAREQSSIGVALFDIDQFKAVNDDHGHPMGDVVLREVARRIETGRRQFDVVARWGGEEFVALFRGADLEAARLAAERVALSVGARPIMLGALAIKVTVSAGVAADTPEHITSMSGLLARADSALLLAKESGRDRVEVESFGMFPDTLAS